MAKSSKTWLQKFRESESSTSVIFGAIVVIVVGILLFNYSRSNPSISEQGEATAAATMTSPTGEQLPTTYVVASGDTLWSVAEKFYGDGFKWVDLVKENNLPQNGGITVGQTLKIPALMHEAASTSEATTTSPGSTPAPEAASVGGNYTVVKGDSLWHIAVTVYGDGYRWIDIYKANKDLIHNPDLIYPGQVFVLP